MVAPVVDELATDYADKAAIVKVNVDETQSMPRSTKYAARRHLSSFAMGRR